jgi:hypothetical protein
MLIIFDTLRQAQYPLNRHVLLLTNCHVTRKIAGRGGVHTRPYAPAPI